MLVVARIVQTELEGITGATAFTQGGGLWVGRKLGAARGGCAVT